MQSPTWRPIAQTIRMTTHDPDVIEEHMEAHEVDLTPLEMSDQLHLLHNPSHPNLSQCNHPSRTIQDIIPVRCSAITTFVYHQSCSITATTAEKMVTLHLDVSHQVDSINHICQLANPESGGTQINNGWKERSSILGLPHVQDNGPPSRIKAQNSNKSSWEAKKRW